MASIRKIAGGVAAFVMLCEIARAAAAPLAGAILTSNGACFVERDGRREPLTAGAEIQVGDVVDVPAGAKLKLRMVDGTVISAGSDSRITIGSYDAGGAAGRDVKLGLAGGILRAIVTKMGNTGRFEVDTATGVAAVRGTDWFIVAKPDSTQIGVLDGLVELRSAATHHAVRIPAGSGSSVGVGKDPLPVRIWRQDEFDAVIARTKLN